MENPLISIIIPVKNGSKTIEACLEGIFTQTLKDVLEVIIIDSGSNDNTLEIIKNFPIRFYQIKPEDFNHGITRNYGISKAKGKFVVLTVQDASPSSNDWLEIMLRHFDDEKVMGVCGQQIVPHDYDKNPLEWFRPYSVPVPQIVEFKNDEFEKLSGKQQHQYCGWDDVNAMYRESALSETPFIRTNFSEDALWAKTALAKGYRLVYDSNASVYHYHYHNFKFMFKRTYTVLYHTRLFFGYNLRYENILKSLIKIFYRAFFKKQIPQRKVYWIFYNISILNAQLCASIIFNINSLFMNPNRLEKSHMFWVGNVPQG